MQAKAKERRKSLQGWGYGETCERGRSPESINKVSVCLATIGKQAYISQSLGLMATNHKSPLVVSSDSCS